MPATRSILLSCLVALCAIACASEPEPTATEATEPVAESTTGAEEPAPSPAPVAEAPSAPPAAEVAPPPEPPKPPTVGILVTHKVKDYDAWKTAFDQHEQARKDAGLIAHALMRDPAKKSVSVWAGAHDLAKPQEMLGSEDMKKTMKDAGVIGKPTIMPMNVVSMSPPIEGGPQPTVGAVIDHKVKDFAAFKAVFDANEQFRKDAGIVGYAVNQNPEDPNHVYVWVEAVEKEKLEAFLKNKDLKAKFKEAGVKGAPKITQLEIVEWKMYAP